MEDFVKKACISCINKLCSVFCVYDHNYYVRVENRENTCSLTVCF